MQTASGDAVRIVNGEAVGAFAQIALQIDAVHEALDAIAAVSEETSATSRTGRREHRAEWRLDPADHVLDAAARGTADGLQRLVDQFKVR